MKRVLLFTILSLAFFLSPLRAQLQQVSQGNGYAEQIFYSIEDGSTTAITHDEWDIAFGVNIFTSAIFVNEATASGGAPGSVQGVELYASTATDFATADTSMITEQLHNDEASWSAGAFNLIAVAEDPFDLGWGRYNTQTQAVTGNRIYFIVDRTGAYRKLMINSLASRVYTFTYANLDGSDENTVTIDKNDYAGRTLAYFSFAEGAQDLEPAQWDLLFTRYTTPLPFQGDFLQYTVTGIFHNDGWEVAEMRDVDLENVEAPSDDEAYSEAYDAIGWDWKEFGQGGFNIVDNLVYFLRRQSDSQTYRIRFADFDGSATGTTSFVLGDEGIVSSLNDRPAGLDAISLFPNPARDFAQLNVDLNRSYSSASLAVVNTLGQIVFQQAGLELLAGNNQLPLEVGQYPKGQYLVRLQLGDGVVTERLIIK